MIDGEFNLLDEPWILVSDMGGKTDTLSLTEVLARAHELTVLAGELPTQDAAVIRLLLGVLYAIFTRQDENGAPLTSGYTALWERLWRRGSFPMDVIGQYLEPYHRRFWLFHPEYPFWQVALDKTPVTGSGIVLKPTSVNASKFIGDIADGDKANLFCGRYKKDTLSFPEAARWLVHLNAFDVSPAGTPGKNSKAVKGFGHPWPANIGLIWASGDTLFQTLMLNLVLTQNQQPWPDGAAWWETEPSPITADKLKRVEIPPPESIVELMSMQYRYVQLRRDGNFVTGYDLWSGVQFESDSMFMVEQMTAWRRDKKGNPYLCQHDSTKQMWRDFAAFVPHKVNDDAPGTVNWISKMQRRNHVLPFLRLNVVGVEYKKGTAVKDVFFDSLQMSASLLSTLDESDKGWIVRITRLLEQTDEAVNALAHFAVDLAAADGNIKNADDNDFKQRTAATPAKEEAYFNLDEPFRKWLVTIHADSDMDKKCQEWNRVVFYTLRSLGEALIQKTGNTAFVGRMVPITKFGRPETDPKKRKTAKTALFSAPIAYTKFKEKLNKTLKINEGGDDK